MRIMRRIVWCLPLGSICPWCVPRCCAALPCRAFYGLRKRSAVTTALLVCFPVTYCPFCTLWLDVVCRRPRHSSRVCVHDQQLPLQPYSKELDLRKIGRDVAGFR